MLLLLANCQNVNIHAQLDGAIGTLRKFSFLLTTIMVGFIVGEKKNLALARLFGVRFIKKCCMESFQKFSYQLIQFLRPVMHAVKN